jgi:hypothetical protein
MTFEFRLDRLKIAPGLIALGQKPLEALARLGPQFVKLSFRRVREIISNNLLGLIGLRTVACGSGCLCNTVFV